MIVQHPNLTGWLIETPEVLRLLNAGHLLVLPDGSQVHPLHFTPVDFANDDIAEARVWAITAVDDWADAREDTLDAKLSKSPARAIFLNTEIVQYFNAGRPATPSGNIYVMANSRAVRKNIPLRTVLENRLAKWISVRAMIATLDDALEEAIEAIEAAATIDDIAAILADLP